MYVQACQSLNECLYTNHWFIFVKINKNRSLSFNSAPLKPSTINIYIYFLFFIILYIYYYYLLYYIIIIYYPLYLFIIIYYDILLIIYCSSRKMPFMHNRGAVARTLDYLKKGEMMLENHVKVAKLITTLIFIFKVAIIIIIIIFIYISLVIKGSNKNYN